ncbi:uncharacterized protein B0P05DRAFT_545252 [Gilbertella persicaria]|uniref:uncharacterized protein n=1 Tax=Gilbertella persicaria TaxID=101096 RepID=UPI002220637F|nr:uncharacterized protein B0P05DRAFT_545252 [Gilbertella persicaria]KAI8076631.1 hypothetical protein B0P05DRAFT_545252 [Gilbertella persicaria]
MTAHIIGTIQRQLSTLFEEFKRTQDTWEELNSHAFPLASSLTNSVILSKYVDEPQYWHPLLSLEFPDIIQKYDAKMQRIIEQQHTKLDDLVEKMAKQQNKMKQYRKELNAICERAENINGQAFVKHQAIFQTCSLDFFASRMEKIIDMYSRELLTKRSLLDKSEKGFKNILSREEGVVLLSIWINQPSIVKSFLQEWQDICATEMNLML